VRHYGQEMKAALKREGVPLLYTSHGIYEFLDGYF
jgi:hypothetical protein